jgi:hypothetical protein
MTMCIQVFFMFPETRQKSLEEIGICLSFGVDLIADILFDDNIPAWKTRSGSSMMDRRGETIEHEERSGNRKSDTTLQHDENVEKIFEHKLGGV